MEDYRSRSYGYGYGDMQIQSYRGPPGQQIQDMRSYTTSYAQNQIAVTNYGREVDFQKGKSRSGGARKWGCLGDPEFQRKRRVASYKVYDVEGSVKGSLRRSFRWLKNKYTRVVYGW